MFKFTIASPLLPGGSSEAHYRKELAHVKSDKNLVRPGGRVQALTATGE